MPLKPSFADDRISSSCRFGGTTTLGGVSSFALSFMNAMSISTGHGTIDAQDGKTHGAGTDTVSLMGSTTDGSVLGQLTAKFAVLSDPIAPRSWEPAPHLTAP